jgi:hypothetical protein
MNLIGYRTSLEGGPDMSRILYWNPVRKARQVQCPKLDSPVCQTRHSGFGKADTPET